MYEKRQNECHRLEEDGRIITLQERARAGFYIEAAIRLLFLGGFGLCVAHRQGILVKPRERKSSLI